MDALHVPLVTTWEFSPFFWQIHLFKTFYLWNHVFIPNHFQHCIFRVCMVETKSHVNMFQWTFFRENPINQKRKSQNRKKRIPKSSKNKNRVKKNTKKTKRKEGSPKARLWFSVFSESTCCVFFRERHVVLLIQA